MGLHFGHTLIHSSCPQDQGRNVDLTNQEANDVMEKIFLQAFSVAITMLCCVAREC